jgi:hypothetical protein
MDKKTKIILGGLFIAAGVGLYIWNKNKDKDDAATASAPSAPATIICNEGKEPCPNNPLICYTKGLRYEGFSPCDVVQTGTPIAEPQPSNGGDENIGTHINTR